MAYTTKQLAEVVVGATENSDDVKALASWLVKELAEQNATHLFDEVVREIEHAWKNTYGAASITIDTASPLTEELRTVISGIAKGATITENIDVRLIGGAKLRIDDKLIDGTIAGTLSSLKRALVANR